ncbi:concanavalin A-like lectin/glucanase [Gigaspora margarita]|uniref:Concanavalin A-like lectin/glucanase n=1 Tax=Gigaspora margarita TaxID=4874 RepID=A0A8H4B3R1_GIGMA|nr:concanavalin A-like lectin/glucanase [Gigaspora margarita]
MYTPISIFCQKQGQRTYRELIAEPTIFTPEYNRIISHAELPIVKNELSITLKIYLESHGRTENNRTPALWLNPNKVPCPRLSITGNVDAGIDMNDYGFLLNQWHLVWNGFTGQISEALMDYSGEDPTKHNDNDDNDESPKKSFVDLTIAFFLGMIVLTGGLFIHKIITRRRYQEIPNPM